MTPMIAGVSGCGSKFDDQGERAPAIQREPIIITLRSTTAIAQGRRDEARSPRLLSIGTMSNKI